MLPQEQNFDPNATTDETIMPKWIKVLFKVYAAIFLIAIIYAVVSFGLIIISSAHVLFSIPSDWMTSPFGLSALGFFALIALFIALETTWAVGLFMLKRWSIPILLFFVVSSFLEIVLWLVNGNYASAEEIVSEIIVLAVLLGAGYGAWTYRKAFSGSSRKLWIQIPLLVVVVPIALFSILSQIYTDDPVINDNDLLVPKVEVLRESDNAHFALSSISELSTSQLSAFDEAREYHKALEKGESIDVGAASTTLNVVVEVTDNFIKASKRLGYQCPSSVNIHGPSTILCPLNELRSMAQVVALRSYVELMHGNTERGLETAFASARFGKLVSSAQPVLIEHLVGLAITGVGIKSVERILLQNTTSISKESLLVVARELEIYKIDGSSLEISFKREYMSGKEGLRSFEAFNGYSWHHNSTHNDFAELARQNIEMARAQCGDELKQKRDVIDARIEGANGSIWWMALKPNGIGEILKQVVAGASLGSVREKECKVNQTIEALQERLRGSI